MRNELKRIRKEKGYTLRTLARELNVATSFLSQIETGQRSGKIGFWIKIQEVFNIPDSEMWKIIKK